MKRIPSAFDDNYKQVETAFSVSHHTFDSDIVTTLFTFALGTVRILIMSSTKSIPYPFSFDTTLVQKPGSPGQLEKQVNLTLQNVRGRIPSVQTSRLRTMILESHADPTKILAHACTYDGLTARLAEEAGFPMVFVSGYAVASANGLPDAGYIALEDMCSKIKETARVVSVPIMVDGDTGYGSPVNVRRTVESFALAGAAGVMIEDQTWPKRESPLLLI
jgi:methylisocitrate lyase